ncbi:Protein of unknown function [Bacillus mycoides]|nr:Protein of unknown function [Bacillus mycoides]
MMKFGETNYTF